MRSDLLAADHLADGLSCGLPLPPHRKMTEGFFYGARLLAVAGDNPATTMVAMKPVAEGMGLDRAGQNVKLNDHSLIAKGVEKFSIPTAGGHQMTTSIPLTRLTLWLATINTSKLTVLAKPQNLEQMCAIAYFSIRGSLEPA